MIDAMMDHGWHCEAQPRDDQTVALFCCSARSCSQIDAIALLEAEIE